MSKPLQLTIHPKDHWWYRSADGSPKASESAADATSAAKRLTDTELAAEFHRAVSSFQRSNDMSEMFPHPNTWSDLERDRGWMFAMERFATLPSYDEVAS